MSSRACSHRAATGGSRRTRGTACTPRCCPAPQSRSGTPTCTRDPAGSGSTGACTGHLCSIRSRSTSAHRQYRWWSFCARSSQGWGGTGRAAWGTRVASVQRCSVAAVVVVRRGSRWWATGAGAQAPRAEGEGCLKRWGSSVRRPRGP